jgi:RNA polymerase sigma factor (sigma-70 family)
MGPVLSRCGARKETPGSRDYLVVTPSPDTLPTAEVPPVAASLNERFDRLFIEHGDGLMRLATVYERDPHLREDLVQEIAFAVWKALPGYRGECSERTFVYRIAHNRAITHGQRARARRERITYEADLADVPDPGPDPATQSLLVERRVELMDAVRTLRPSLQQVVMLTLEGFGNADVADVLGITPNAVAVRLTRARAELATLIAGGDQ